MQMTMTMTTVFEKFPELEPISPHRKRAIELMLTCGWVLARLVKKTQRHYEFKRPDGSWDGTCDVMTISHRDLECDLVAALLESYEPDLAAKLREARAAWVKEKLNSDA